MAKKDDQDIHDRHPADDEAQLEQAPQPVEDDKKGRGPYSNMSQAERDKHFREQGVDEWGNAPKQKGDE